MEIMIYRWKETNGGKGGPGSRQNMLDMKMLKTKMLKTKVHNGLRIGIKGTSNSRLLNVVKMLSGSISLSQLYLKHIK